MYLYSEIFIYRKQGLWGGRAETQLHPILQDIWNKLECIRFGSSPSGAYIKEDRTMSATKNSHCYGRTDNGLSTHVCQEHLNQAGFFLSRFVLFSTDKK